MTKRFFWSNILRSSLYLFQIYIQAAMGLPELRRGQGQRQHGSAGFDAAQAIAAVGQLPRIVIDDGEHLAAEGALDGGAAVAVELLGLQLGLQGQAAAGAPDAEHLLAQ